MEFQYTDHLGNTRVSFRANGTQLEKVSDTSFDPWGVVLNGINQANGFQNRFEFQVKEKESTFPLNRINLGARTLNPTIDRFDRVDPLAEKYESFSSYIYVNNNPLRFIDPTGMEGEDAFFSTHYEGKAAQDAFRKEQAKVLAEKDDKPKPKSKNTIPTSTKNGVQSSSSIGDNIAKSTLAFIAIDVAVPEPTDLVLPKWAGYAVAGTVAGTYLYSSKIVDKMSKEIDRILKKAAGPSGVVYELRVRKSGTYIDVRGNKITLNAGDIWKYGETTIGQQRYSSDDLQNMVPGGVTRTDIYYGNPVQIKVMEKYLIYGHYFNHGELPPGNKYFRKFKNKII